ncbi:MAG: hypothetical protein IKU37_04605 [Candidatus Gastranaerophilales bacterium]|nr:hypothetical protein [Candidatus Gastranaerophilales bacterium]
MAIKHKTTSKEELIFLGFSLILTSKSFFAVNPIGYGNFGYCLLIFYIFLQLQKFINKKWLINSIIFIFIFVFINNLTLFIRENKTLFAIKNNLVALKKVDKNIFEKTNLFIEKHIKKDENFIVLPEGQIFNVLHNKPYKFYNSTFTPLDFETFKEKQLINQLQDKRIEYIIFYPRDTLDYGKQGICFDYAVDFCKYIMDNYTQVATLKENKQVTIFKIKK